MATLNDAMYSAHLDIHTDRKIEKIILHCSATREGQWIKTETIKRWHTEGRGWSDIGYHFVIHLDGSVDVGRPLDRSGAHTKGYNRTSIGICYIGGVEATRTNGKYKAKDTRTPEQKSALRGLVWHLLQVYPDATVHGHNEFAAKACPSFDVQAEKWK